MSIDNVLIEFHVLQNHAPGNLNRDRDGNPKNSNFGRVRRGRISSQSLKRPIRLSNQIKEASNQEIGTRTRQLPQLVYERLVQANIDPELARVAATKVTGFGNGDNTEKGVGTSGKLETAQMISLGEADIAAVTAVLEAACRANKDPEKWEKQKNLQTEALQDECKQVNFRTVPLPIALFGRMVTSKAFRNIQAAVQVAHAITTHATETEFDFFAAVDDLTGTGGDDNSESHSGAGFLDETQFNSGCYYEYFSTDLQGLIDNLTGKSFMFQEPTPATQAEATEMAIHGVEAVLRSIIFNDPTGKQNSYATHPLPSLVMVDIKTTLTPVSHTNAFVDPVRVSERSGDLITASMGKFKTHVECAIKGFNLQSKRRLLLAPFHPGYTIEGVETISDLNTLCQQLVESLKND